MGLKLKAMTAGLPTLFLFLIKKYRDKNESIPQKNGKLSR